MKKQINVQVPEELHQAVRVKAAQEKRTVSAVIREFLEEWVKDKDGEPNHDQDAVRRRPK